MTCPGRHRESPKVRLSEVMLQQTQVATVLAYFARFCGAFPVSDLARPAWTRCWPGADWLLPRARNLHRCAQEIVTHAVVFPRSAAVLVPCPASAV